MYSSRKRIKKQYPLLWVIEPLMEETSYLEKPMFGCLAVYLHGRLMLVLASGEEPWNGLLIPTEHQFHDAILQEFRDVVQHSVLKNGYICLKQQRILKQWLLILLRQLG